MFAHTLLVTLLSATWLSAHAAEPSTGQALLSLQCRQDCELVCEEGGTRTSYPASGRVEVYPGSGGVQFVRLNQGRWLRLGSDATCLFDGFE